jgi:hypothetical protein
MATGDTTQVTLYLAVGAETIHGTLADEHGNERPFWGWLELSGALDELRAGDAFPEGGATTPGWESPTETNQSQEEQ